MGGGGLGRLLGEISLDCLGAWRGVGHDAGWAMRRSSACVCVDVL